MTKLTIMMPVYNEEKYILETLQSIKNQTYKNFTCIIADNNSSDKTGEICKRFVKDDNRFQYYKQVKNIGSIRNLEYIVKKIDTEYSMLFSGHDILKSEFISKTIEIIENNSNISLVFSSAIGINENSQMIYNKFMQQTYKFTGNSLSRYIKSIKELSNCTIVQGIFRSNILDDFQFTHNTTGIDHIFLSHLLWYGELYVVKEILYKRRFFEKRDTTDKERITGRKEEIKNNYKIMYQAYLDDFNSLYKGPEEFRIFLNNKILDILTLRFGISHLYNENYIERDLK